MSFAFLINNFMQYFAIFILFSTILNEICDAALIASGQIEQCINEDDNVDNYDCSPKMIVTLTLTGGQDEVETLQTSLTEVYDADGTKRELEYPVSIALSKTDVYIRYPLTYKQTFAADLTEKVITMTPGLINMNPCVDYGSNPTCGYDYTSNGDRIENSQGFCCTCEGFSNTPNRGTDCDALGFQPDTAHCLVIDDSGLWYSAYSLGSPETQFTVAVKTTYQNNDTNSKAEILFLSPSNTAASSASGALVARLIGDFATYRQIEDFDMEFLFMPSSPSTNERVKSPWANAMLIPDSAISWYGDECDRIGTSYYAFRYQSEACSRTQGDCLKNQLEDFHQAGQHFAKNYPGATLGKTTERVYLAFQSEVTQTSLVTLTLSTDSVKFVINRAHGYISSCYIPNFESLKAHGRLNCTVVNDGRVTAMFRLAVVNCTNGISPILERRATIAANKKEIFEYDIYSENQADSSHKCVVKLYDSLEVLIHNISVSFQSTELIEDKGAQGGNGAEPGDVIQENASPQQCIDYCGSFFDVVCFALYQCWSQIGILVGILLGICICGPLLIKLSINLCCRALRSNVGSANPNANNNNNQNISHYPVPSPMSINNPAIASPSMQNVQNNPNMHGFMGSNIHFPQNISHFLPRPHLPHMQMPNIHMPNINMPNMHMPQWHVPHSQTPNSNMAQMPQQTMPSMNGQNNYQHGDSPYNNNNQLQYNNNQYNKAEFHHNEIDVGIYDSSRYDYSDDHDYNQQTYTDNHNHHSDSRPPFKKKLQKRNQQGQGKQRSKPKQQTQRAQTTRNQQKYNINNESNEFEKKPKMGLKKKRPNTTMNTNNDNNGKKMFSFDNINIENENQNSNQDKPRLKKKMPQTARNVRASENVINDNNKRKRQKYMSQTVRNS